MTIQNGNEVASGAAGAPITTPRTTNSQAAAAAPRIAKPLKPKNTSVPTFRAFEGRKETLLRLRMRKRPRQNLRVEREIDAFHGQRIRLRVIDYTADGRVADEKVVELPAAAAVDVAAVILEALSPSPSQASSQLSQQSQGSRHALVTLRQPELAAEARRLRAEGMKAGAIASRLSISKATLYRLLRASDGP